MDTISDRDHEEILALYQATIEDIERSKQWLWTVTYHTIIAQGGLLALHTAYTSSHHWTKWLFIIFSVGIAGVGSLYVRLARMGLAHFRERANRCLKQFGQPFQDVFGSRVEKREIPSIAIIWGTALLIIALIYFGSASTPAL